ncbi:response regulator [Paenibacillus abyssi]|uniref:Circadian input-output histidine kinase CikA n=1 Tax=Paenibacillus abyssi TaxID=1340531 RepID=A0A917FPA8_9BACL|nr:response regulator [Paenibacillus abyssi]GGF92469.1 hypothetical protein GCM10010916_07320 [Paenibacillus abyssi]
MSHEDKLYSGLEEAAEHIMKMISELIHVNTFFVASNDRVSNTILKVFNRHENLVEEGVVLPYEQTYCSLVIEGTTEPLVIEDTTSHPLTSELGVTKALGKCSFIGVPIWHKNGNVFGTICAMDRKPYNYSDRDIALLNSMATFLSYVIELETTVVDLQRAKTETLEAKEAAERATQAKADFLAIMSHEIRTPMNGIMGMTGLLHETELTDEQREYTEIIRSSNESLLAILNDILDFSKIESGHMMLEHQPFELKPCVEDILDLFSSRTVGKDIELVSCVDPEIPQFVVGDVTRVRQVLVNLIGNAIKFTEKGEIFVSVSKQSTDGQDFELYFQVKDTGIGIPKDKHHRLFQSFSQAHDVTASRKYGGTGLGLAICKQLVELMGGQIWVESDEGEGATFHFTIRAKRAELFSENKNNAARLRQKRVLIVDDNSTNLRILKKSAERWGMYVKATVSASEALSWIEQGEIFDLAIIDMLMAEMDGNQLGGKIRKHRTIESLPMIMLTSVGSNPSRVDLESVFSAVVSKPVRDDHLLEVMLSSLFDRQAKPSRNKPTVLLDANMGAKLPLRILVAEDNAINQKLFLRILEKMGYTADVAANGLEALQSVTRLHYDLVFMDVQMPVMDGLDAARNITNSLGDTKRPVIIAVTANARQEDREQCLAAGMHDYISKPLRIEEVQRLLEHWAKEIRLPKKPEHQEENRPDVIVDYSIIEEIRSLDDTSAFFEELYRMFDHEGAAYIEQINELWRQKDMARLHETIHLLKGVSLNIGAAELANMCSRLEAEIKHAEQIEILISSLREVFEHTRIQLGKVQTLTKNE